MMVTPVAAAYIGRMLFDTRISPQAHLQRVLSDVTGLDISIPWLGDGFWATVAIILIDSWQWIPFMTLLLLAGMQGIPEDIYEAARVDGATSFQILRKITFPILLPISITVILIRGLEIFKIIDVIVVTTGGGPGSATESLTMYIFDTALTFGNFGYAAAISFALLVLVIIFATLFLSLGRRVRIAERKLGGTDHEAEALAASSALYLVVIFWCIVCLFPFYWLLTTSFKTPLAVSRGPKYMPYVDYQPTGEHWDYLFDEQRDCAAAPLPQQSHRSHGQHDSGRRHRRHGRIWAGSLQLPLAQRLRMAQQRHFLLDHLPALSAARALCRTLSASLFAARISSTRISA